VHVVEAVDEWHHDRAFGRAVTDAPERLFEVGGLGADEDDSMLILEARHGPHGHAEVAEAHAPHVESAARDGIGCLLARDDRHGQPGSCERGGEEAADPRWAEHRGGGRGAGGGQRCFTYGLRTLETEEASAAPDHQRVAYLV